MIDVQRYSDLGTADFGWLQARYHFSFSHYVNRDRMGFGPLRVINDDTVKAGAGFEPHSHQNMEIITYVKTGAITHKDGLGNEGRTAAGDVQVMSAGTGITHSEFNREDEDTTLYQIWIEPARQNVTPQWKTRRFPADPADTLQLLASGRADHAAMGALPIHQDAALYGGRLAADTVLTHRIEPGRRAYLLVSDGTLQVNGTRMSAGDGAEIIAEQTLTFKAHEASEVVLIDLP